MPDITVLSGGAKGVDSLAERFAKEYNLGTNYVASANIGSTIPDNTP